MSGASIELLKRQINDDYYHGNKSFQSIVSKYKYYSEDELKDVLGIYDLTDEPESNISGSRITVDFIRDWEQTCRKLNPKAWEGR